MLKALQAVGIVGESCRQNLDRNSAVESRVPRPVNFSHATCSEGREYLVRSQSSAGYQAHSWIARNYNVGIATTVWGAALVSGVVETRPPTTSTFLLPIAKHRR